MNPQIKNEQMIEVMNSRYAVKQFDPTKKISDADWNVVAESLRLSPSSYGLQPWQFLVITNPEIRKELRANSWNQTQVTDASHFVVLTYKVKLDEAHIQKYVESTAKIRGVPAESLKGFNDMMVGDLVKGPRSQSIDQWAQRQTYIAMGQSMLAAATIGVDSCPLEGLDATAYNKILKLEGTGFATLGAIAFGYRHADDKYQFAKKSRFEAPEVIKYV